jgi:anthranilate synthase/aminodeoxychorismate synthase-like glutamine amidotransferase
VVLVIDNYDSFTWNLVQYLGELGAEPVVRRNDEISVDAALALSPSGIVISPGPGRPEQAGVSNALIAASAGRFPLLGVCLGHQCLASVFGGRIVRAERLMHGKTSQIIHTGRGIFEGMDNPFGAMRYHSLLVERESMPAQFRVVAWTPEDEVMGIEHVEHSLWGVQFHPESILTQDGKRLIANFVTACRPRVDDESTHART